jgi:hypothetical protein
MIEAGWRAKSPSVGKAGPTWDTSIDRVNKSIPLGWSRYVTQNRMCCQVNLDLCVEAEDVDFFCANNGRAFTIFFRHLVKISDFCRQEAPTWGSKVRQLRAMSLAWELITFLQLHILGLYRSKR